MTSAPRPLAVLAALLLLPGCISLGSKPPEKLLSLSSSASLPAGTVRSGAVGGSITVADLETPRKLETARVPVQVDATSVAYVKDAQWVDTPRQLFRRLLSETLAARGTAIVLDPSQYSADPGRRLLGELVDFGVDARTNSAVVTFDGTLVAPDGQSITKRRFSATVPVGEIKAETVGAPINQAANQVAAEVADWVSGG